MAQSIIPVYMMATILSYLPSCRQSSSPFCSKTKVVRATPRVHQKYNPQNFILRALLNNYFLKTSFLHSSSPIFYTQKYFELATTLVSWTRTGLETKLVGLGLFHPLDLFRWPVVPSFVAPRVSPFLMNGRRSTGIFYQNGARAREKKHRRRLGARRRSEHMRGAGSIFQSE